MIHTYTPIENLGKIVTGKTPRTSVNEYWGGKIPFITPTDIKSFDIYYCKHTDRYLTMKGVDSQKKTLLPAGSIGVVCIGSTIGKMCKTIVPSVTNQQINSIIPNDSYNADYLYYTFRYFVPFLRMIGSGTGSGKQIISKNKFAKLKYPIFQDIKYQQKIASILSTYDNLIENNNKRIKILEQMAENLYKEWFVRFRFPCHENCEFENGIPKGWKIDKIKRCVKRLPYNRLYKESELDSKGKIIVIDQSVNEYLGFHNNEPSHIADYKRPIILFGDHSCKFKLMCKDFSLGENVIPFVSNDEKNLNTYYLYYAIHKLIVTEEYKRHWGRLVNMKMIIPPLNLQNDYVEKIVVIEREKENLFEQNQSLIKQRDLLLPRLMSGKLQVK